MNDDVSVCCVVNNVVVEAEYDVLMSVKMPLISMRKQHPFFCLQLNQKIIINLIIILNFNYF